MNSRILYLTVIPFHLLLVVLISSAVILWRKPHVWPYALATFCGFLVAFIDIHSDEIQFPALLLLAFSFFLGFINASSAWRWGLLVGLWVPLVQPLRSIGSQDADNVSVLLPSLAGFVFSFAGAYGGAVLKKLSPVIVSPPKDI